MGNQHNSGSTLITVLIVAAIFIILASGVVELNKYSANLVLDYCHEAQAMYLAEGGLAVAETALRYNPRHRQTLNQELSTGTIQIAFQDTQAKIQGDTLLLPIEAIGRAGTAKQTLAQLFTLYPYPKHPVFGYCLFQSHLSQSLPLPGLYIEGDVHANGTIEIENPAIINGLVSSAERILYDPSYDHSLTMFHMTNAFDLPTFDWDYYETIVTKVVKGPADIKPVQPEISIYVCGDAKLSGHLPAGTAIIASGKLTLDESVHCSEMVFLAAREGISLFTVGPLTATMYSPSCVTCFEPIYLSGVVAASLIDLAPGSQIVYKDPSLSLLATPLPGLTIKRSNWYHKYFTTTAISSYKGGYLMKLVNTMERAVKEQFEDMKDHFLDFCWCERCRYDVLALTLNCLPPTYVVSEEGEIFSRTATLRQQYQADIAVALVQAVTKVKADPRH